MSFRKTSKEKISELLASFSALNRESISKLEDIDTDLQYIVQGRGIVIESSKINYKDKTERAFVPFVGVGGGLSLAVAFAPSIHLSFKREQEFDVKELKKAVQDFLKESGEDPKEYKLMVNDQSLNITWKPFRACTLNQGADVHEGQ